MADYSTTQTVLFPDLLSKPLVVEFDQAQSRSDGGAVLLKAADRRRGPIERLAGIVRDRREESEVRHEVGELLGQRIYGIACGYPDCADAVRLADDPIHKLLAGRDPVDGSGSGRSLRCRGWRTASPHRRSGTDPARLREWTHPGGRSAS